MDSTHYDRFANFVVKVSKLCNLRCRYCYEYNDLSKTEAMTRVQLQRFYHHLSEYYGRRDQEDGQRTQLRFSWHGGEPLLRPPNYYWNTLTDQARILGPALNRHNGIQTNLVLLDKERLDLLKNAFDTVGVSIDLFGGLRVDASGHDKQARVLANMDLLRQEGIPFGAITVLTRQNLDKIDRVYRFFRTANLGFRVLPLFDGAFVDQHEGFDLSTRDVLEAFTKLVDLWLLDDNPLHVSPIVEHMATVLAYHLPAKPRIFYDRRDWTATFLINTNGDCFAYGDPYPEARACLGNIFDDSMDSMLSTPTFDTYSLECERRIAVNCLSCKYFGSCDGFPIAAETTNCREVGPQGIRLCVLERNLFAYIDSRLHDVGAFTSTDEVDLGSRVVRNIDLLSGGSITRPDRMLFPMTAGRETPDDTFESSIGAQA